MPKSWITRSAVLLLLIPAFASAEYQTQSFPPAHELFAPLLADPSTPQFAFELGAPVSHSAIARIDVGDYLGIYRWALGDIGALQLSVGGAINTRFDATTAHNLQVIDFYGNVPLDLRIWKFSLRSLFYHDSSHLGDDYLRENNIQSMNNSWEAWREILSFQPWKPLRVYGGYQQAIHTKPNWEGRRSAQGGFELYFNHSEHAFWHPYWANDVQFWQRSDSIPTWVSQLGFKTGDKFSRGRGITYFAQFQSGPRYEGQFFPQKETTWTAGLKFALSDNLFAPADEPAAIVPPMAQPAGSATSPAPTPVPAAATVESSTPTVPSPAPTAP